jgi:hypothetical protein
VTVTCQTARALGAAVKRHKAPTGAAVVLYAIQACVNEAREDAAAWPSWATLQEATGLGRSQVHAHVKFWRDCGVLVAVGRAPGVRADRAPVAYRLALDAPATGSGRPDAVRGPAGRTPRKPRGPAGRIHGVRQAGPEEQLVTTPMTSNARVTHEVPDTVVNLQGVALARGALRTRPKRRDRARAMDGHL